MKKIISIMYFFCFFGNAWAMDGGVRIDIVDPQEETFSDFDGLRIVLDDPVQDVVLSAQKKYGLPDHCLNDFKSVLNALNPRDLVPLKKGKGKKTRTHRQVKPKPQPGEEDDEQDVEEDNDAQKQSFDFNPKVMSGLVKTLAAAAHKDKQELERVTKQHEESQQKIKPLANTSKLSSIINLITGGTNGVSTLGLAGVIGWLVYEKLSGSTCK